MSDDRDLPTAAIMRIAKEGLPEGFNISKDAKVALVKAATHFIVHTTTYANEITVKKKRKTITGEDVIEAMGDIEFDEFQECLKESLEMFRAKKDGKTLAGGGAKKPKAKKAKTDAPAEDNGEEEEEEEDEDDED
eukprot:comp9511_c0_seq1/m.4548 comp9511_c0_seq1/g.4548  ORF comp9511_c0_seq1/g.4548 comp9511_c0_seq1/m.4548 type:complete len:135 (-) comp9511_c0_seq1:616-1020(-)